MSNGQSFTTVPYAISSGTVSLPRTRLRAGYQQFQLRLDRLEPVSVRSRPEYVGGHGQHFAEPPGLTAKNQITNGLIVDSTVTAIKSGTGLVYTDPNPTGVPITLGSAGNNNYPYFVPGANAAIIAGTFVPSGAPLPGLR